MHTPHEACVIRKMCHSQAQCCRTIMDAIKRQNFFVLYTEELVSDESLSMSSCRSHPMSVSLMATSVLTCPSLKVVWHV